MAFDITSTSNDRIKWLVRLRDRRHRDAEDVFVVEGERLYRRALTAGLTPQVTFVSDPGIETVGDTVTVAPDVLDKASYRSRSQGLVAVFDQLDTSLDGIDLSDDPLVLVVESVEKPGNLGAMCRTAAAAGVDAVITVGETVDAWNPNALRASTGAVFSVPLAVSSWEEVEAWLADREVSVVAASPFGRATLWETDLAGSVAVVIGAEDRGLSERAESVAHELVAIPQANTGVDSLNASVAAALVLFEAIRQRTLGRS